MTVGDRNMDWNAIGAMGEVIGAAAVVISLIYVALQVRQNTASSKSTVETEIALAISRVTLEPAQGSAAGVVKSSMLCTMSTENVTF